MNLILDFLKSRRSVRWLGHLTGLVAAGVWLSLDVDVLAGPGVGIGLGLCLLAFEILFVLGDRRQARLKALAPTCFPLKNLSEDDRDFLQRQLGHMPGRSLVRALVAWGVAASVLLWLGYNLSAVLLALSLGATLSALIQGWGNALLLKRVLPFFYFESDYAHNLGRWLPSLGARFRRGLFSPLLVLVLPIASAFALQHELGLWSLLWIVLCTVLAALACGWTLQSLVAEPIQDLRHALLRFGQGDLQALLDVTSGDDLGHATETYNKTVRAIDRRFFVLERFGHAVAPGKSEALFEGGLRLDGEFRSVAVLECVWMDADAGLQGVEPTVRLNALNRFYEVVQDAVDQAQGASLRSGEGRVVAVWGAPLVDAQAVQGALAAAWSLQAQLKVWASQTRLRGGATPHWGLGIASGQATVGLVGPKDRQHYAVLGGPVTEVRSLAAREGGPWVDERSAAAARAPFAVQITSQGTLLCAGPEAPQPSLADLGFSPGDRL